MKNNEYAALTLKEALERLSEPAPTLILFHIHPDADAVGSAFALSLWLAEQGSPAYCLCADEMPERLAFLVKGLQKSVLAYSVPKGFENARVITVDTASPAQLGSLYDLYGDRVSLMIDHHERGTPYADHLIAPCAAAGEIVYDLIAASGADMPRRCSELLYAAIVSDTGGFRYSNTTPETHLRAAALLSSGIDAADLCHRLLEMKSRKVMTAEHAGFERIRLSFDGRVATITFPHDLAVSLGLSDGHLCTLIDLARQIEGVEVAAVIRQTGNAPVFRLSARANIDLDVAAVCAAFGGGGHRRAAGGTMEGFATIEQAETAFLNALEPLMAKE